MASIRVDIYSGDNLLFAGSVERFTAPSHAGVLEIQAPYKPMLARLCPGVLRMVMPGSGIERRIPIEGGTLDLRGSRATILCHHSYVDHFPFR